MCMEMCLFRQGNTLIFILPLKIVNLRFRRTKEMKLMVSELVNTLHVNAIKWMIHLTISVTLKVFRITQLPM